MDQIEITPVTPEQATLYADLARRTFLDTFASENTAEDMADYVSTAFAPEAIARELADPHVLSFLAWVDGEPAGYLKLNLPGAQTEEVAGNTLEVERIYVAARWLGTGLGRALMVFAIDEALRRGCEAIWLGVWEHNARAIAFYKRQGFAAFATHRFMLGSDEQTDVLMRLDLLQSHRPDGDRRMTFGFADIPDQSGTTAIVTGANTGIGLEIARELAAKGARVLLACRSEDKARAAIANIEGGNVAGTLDFLPLDLTDMASIRQAAALAEQEDQIDTLINNAGIMIPPLEHGIGGAESQFATNYLGHFALTGLLLPKLAQNGGARVISQASIAHKGARIDFDNLDASKGYSRTRFYGQSKLANLVFALELDRRLRAAGSPVTSIACHPGVAQSDLTRNLGMLGSLFGPMIGLMLNTSRQGALPALQAATDPAAQGGDYYGSWGFREMSGNRSGRAYATATARDPELGKRLWDVSIDLTGVDPGLPPA